MFLIQVIGAFIKTLVSYTTTWWMISGVQNMCDTERLPKGSLWMCPGKHNVYTLTVMWGVIGPSRVFFPHGLYSKKQKTCGRNKDVVVGLKPKKTRGRGT